MARDATEEAVDGLAAWKTRLRLTNSILAAEPADTCATRPYDQLLMWLHVWGRKQLQDK